MSIAEFVINQVIPTKQQYNNNKNTAAATTTTKQDSQEVTKALKAQSFKQ